MTLSFMALLVIPDLEAQRPRIILGHGGGFVPVVER